MRGETPRKSRKPLPQVPESHRNSREIPEGTKLSRPMKPIPNKTSNDTDSVTSSQAKVRHSKLKTEDIDVEVGKSAPVSVEKPTTPVKSVERSPTPSVAAVNRFKGANQIQYGLWAHYMALGAASMCLCMGIFSILWSDAQTYKCKINGKLISSTYLYDLNGICPSVYNHNGKTKFICCDPDKKSSLQGYIEMGAAYILYSIFIVLFENTSWGFGLWFPNDNFFFRNQISLIGILHFLAGVAGLSNYATCLAGGCLVFTGLVYQKAAYRFEAGDGGREQQRKQKEAAAARKAKNDKENKERPWKDRMQENMQYALTFNPITFYRRIYNEDKLSSYIWVFIFVTVNIVLFSYIVYVWYAAVGAMGDGLLNGTLDVTCTDTLCHIYRKAVRYGPVSYYAPWAKGFGTCLNLNCALLLLPVVKMILRKISNLGESFAKTQMQSEWLTRFFAHPIARYIPLQKNIEFHKLCAGAVFLHSWGHMIFHWLNLYEANDTTMRFFRFLRWDGTDFFTGALATFAMFIIYTGAPNAVKWAKFEIFFTAHHWFTIFYLALFLHGPNFFYWTCIPVFLYLYERYLQLYRGSRPFMVLKVEWIPPVMALYMRPVNKEDFQFKEGQYLYLSCPFISPTQWHPFTISSASDDMHFGPRIHLETGEEVVEVPRPSTLPKQAKWNKYCLVSQDWEKLETHEYIEKSETGYLDYVTCHIKVHGLEEPVARSWTRKLKEYFELLSPTGKKFPFYFMSRDTRGDIQIGRRFGPDGVTPILRIDGPHSAPAEHYSHYGTLMLVGAGIGLTPCVSILSALTKYRWRKNFTPELLHFYWIVRYQEIDSYQWLVHTLAELSYELKRARHFGQIEKRYYCEINIYITGYDPKTMKGDDDTTAKPLLRSKKRYSSALLKQTSQSFTADDLYDLMLAPMTPSKDQVKVMTAAAEGKTAHNRLQDVWVWQGRPHWDAVFTQMKEQRQHSDIGVCFCGAAPIGADLTTMCEKYSNASEDCLFSLHKENF